jgi:hypothetical protein
MLENYQIIDKGITQLTTDKETIWHEWWHIDTSRESYE